MRQSTATPSRKVIPGSCGIDYGGLREVYQPGADFPALDPRHVIALHVAVETLVAAVERCGAGHYALPEWVRAVRQVTESLQALECPWERRGVTRRECLERWRQAHYTMSKAIQRLCAAGLDGSNECGPAFAEVIRALLPLNGPIVDWVKADPMVKGTGRKRRRRRGTPGTKPSGLDGYRPADTLWHEEGIKPQRLSEAKREGKVRWKSAPSGQLDSRGRRVRILYHAGDAVKHCKPKHVTKKTRRKMGLGDS